MMKHCEDCGKPAKNLYLVNGKKLAESCAADKLGLTLSAFRKVKKEIEVK